MMCRIQKNILNRLFFLPLFLYLATCPVVTAQKLPDSLKNKSYEYLNNRINQYEQDSINVQVYLQASLAKAKKEKDTERILKAYEDLAYLSYRNLNLAYADSTIVLAKKINDAEYISSAYATKGAIYYSNKKYQKALDNYITANDYAEKTNDDYLKHKVKYNVASIKLYLGFYSEAATALKECADFFKNENTAGYINSLHALSLCYNKIGKYELCSQTNAIGLKAAEKISLLDRSYFIHSEGVNQYSKKNYTESIKMINEALPLIIKNHDFANESVGYFYIGKSYLALGNKEAALNYFRKVDRIFVEKNFIRPDIRENFEILINHYKEEGNTKVQLHYVEKLIKADSILSENFRYISGKMHKEYDSRKLEQAKAELEKELASTESTAYVLYITVTVFFFLILFLLYRYYTTQRTYRQKFEALMEGTTVTEEAENTTPEKEESKKPDLSPEVIATITKQLEKFESQKKFLQNDLTLVSLAAAFGTNANYLSKVIGYSRDKNYINYINDLRIDYIVRVLKNESKFRNYTIKALAEEAGFSTPRPFTKAFFAHTGIYPSYFITELTREYV